MPLKWKCGIVSTSAECDVGLFAKSFKTSCVQGFVHVSVGVCPSVGEVGDVWLVVDVAIFDVVVDVDDGVEVNAEEIEEVEVEGVVRADKDGARACRVRKPIHSASCISED